MAGLGRRTHYRKHLTDSVLNDLPEPKEIERIAKVVSTRGLNQFDILVASQNNEVVANRTPQLAILPTKFHKLVWVKRNDFVIVEAGDDKTENDKDKKDGIRYIISHILYKDQIKHLKSKDLWPTNDPEFQSGAGEEVAEGPREEDDGIVYGSDYYDMGEENDDDLFFNTNRWPGWKFKILPTVRVVMKSNVLEMDGVCHDGSGCKKKKKKLVMVALIDRNPVRETSKLWKYIR